MLKKIKGQIKDWSRFCYRSLACQKNALRDALIISSVMIALGGLMVYSSRPVAPEIEEQPEVQTSPLTEQEITQAEEESVGEIVSQVATEAWMPYQNTWYGFLLKYPEMWADPVIKKPVAGAGWEQQVQFRTKQLDDSNPFSGFDMVIYSVAKTKEISRTEEYPQLKNSELKTDPECATIEGHLLETGDYPAEEIYLPANDACYNTTLFFSNTRGEYMYNLVPRLKEGAGLAGDPSDEISSHLPEFFAVASTLNFIDIVRPKPVPVKPRITAPRPVSYKTVGGRLVCAKKNDKPSKSDKNKGKHLDMECCLDPDEYPNPHCTY